MATIKSYSDLQQSKKLAEILPLESADMHWQDASKEYENPYGIYDRHFRLVAGNSSKIINNKHDFRKGFILPAWSLATLLSVLPILERKGYQKAKPQLLYDVAISKWIVDSHVYTTNGYDNSVDACYEMIIHLHELNLL